MKVTEFLRKYSNLPLAIRYTPISFKDAGDKTLSDVNAEIGVIEGKIRRLQTEEEKLLELASIVLDRV